MKIIFLDIDGVLNNRKTQIPYGIDISCVDNFNYIIQKTNANIVLISSWRYMIMQGEMKLKGFEYLLRSHGVNCKDRLIGLTSPDEIFYERWYQVEHWIKHTENKIDSFVILDDYEDFPNYPQNYIQTDGYYGLTFEDAKKAVHILNKELLNETIQTTQNT